MNHQHKVDLILAEQARVAGDVAVAIDHYEAAITGARENAYRHEEALANECYARFWVERGNDRFAMQFMREAHALYKRWGAIAIVEHLEAQYPQWAKLDTLDIAQPHPETSLTSTYEKLALRSVLETSRSITAELTLDRLLEKIMNIVLENAGAQRGLLLLKQERQWVVQATAAVDQSQPQVRQALRLMDYDELARSVVRYVARTGQTVILGDTAGAGQFVQDPYFQRRQVKSLLCLPLLNQGQIGGILYLENNLATDVFTSDRVALLEMLATQMAISIENARLYDRLGNALSTRTKALNSAEDQIRSLFENSTLGIALTTFDGQIITTNQALLGMLGYEEPELQSRNIVTLYHDPTQRTSLLQQLQTKQAVQNFGVEFRRKDRTVLFASLNVSLVTHNEREVLLTVVEDVTDKIKAEEALQTSQDLLQSALDALSANIAVLDQNGTIITVNASWRTFAEANGLAWTDHGLGRSYLEPAVAAAAQAAVGAAESATGIQALLSAQQDSFTLDYACHGPAEERWFAMRATRFESREGLRVVVSHEDITERVQAENQLKQAAAIAERDRIARELHDAVTQTLFSASGIAEATPRTWRKDPAMAQKNMAALTLMLRGALAEMRTLLLELRPDALRGQSLGQLLQTLVQATQSRTRTSISLAVNGNCPLPDEITLACYRIVQESLTNAVKHAEATEVRLIIDCDQNGLVLQIRDNGRGFDPSTVPAGHFGINFIRERVREIGGTFSIDSEPGAGTQIVVSWNVPQTSA
jgi:PAS domain S-box-containing protein